MGGQLIPLSLLEWQELGWVAAISTEARFNGWSFTDDCQSLIELGYAEVMDNSGENIGITDLGWEVLKAGK